jgi:hypothetical protein
MAGESHPEVHTPTTEGGTVSADAFRVSYPETMRPHGSIILGAAVILFEAPQPTEQFAVVPPFVPEQLQFHGPEPLTAQAVPELHRLAAHKIITDGI